jgi:hypothetical protein
MQKSSSLCLYSSNLGTFWLKIEQFWPFEEISIFSNGQHAHSRTVVRVSRRIKVMHVVQHFRTPTKMAATAELNLT